MSVLQGPVQKEVSKLEESLVAAELGPDPRFFEGVLADELVLVSEDGKSFLAKHKVVEAHQPGKGAKFTHVQMSDMTIIDHGTAAVVTCTGTYETSQSKVVLKFMRVWLKKNDRWQVIAGSIHR